MPSRSSKPKREGTPHDFTTIARRVVERAIGEKLDGSPLDDPNAGKNPAAVALGKLGGAKVKEVLVPEMGEKLATASRKSVTRRPVTR